MIGHPLILDELYGDEKLNRRFIKFLKMKRFFLHASMVEFPHPVGGAKIVITSNPPHSFTAALKKLREST
jgi:23S rRNA pseudouridine955/2504/2580 synthase